jgi:hypothetical protein
MAMGVPHYFKDGTPHGSGGMGAYHKMKDGTLHSGKTHTKSSNKATISKVKKIKKPYARKIQILTVLEQRAKFGGKPQQAKLAKAAKESLRRKHGTQKKSKKS